MPEPRVPVSLSRRHREALERVAATFGCPQERLIDEAVEHYLRRLGVAAPPPASVADPDPARHADAAWTSVLR
ncbi:MAG: hypothetical protein K6T74_05500 [Geminicoccaceae bacterium]|nr:hypothetical protein [Geminicoccaceae bacterium]